jgi:hypothetical protein
VFNALIAKSKNRANPSGACVTLLLLDSGWQRANKLECSSLASLYDLCKTGANPSGARFTLRILDSGKILGGDKQSSLFQLTIIIEPVLSYQITDFLDSFSKETRQTIEIRC